MRGAPCPSKYTGMGWMEITRQEYYSEILQLLNAREG